MPGEKLGHAADGMIRNTTEHIAEVGLRGRDR